MQILPQIEPITNLQKAHNRILSMLPNGPVILTQNSKTAAVIVSPAQWNATAAELARLRRIVKMDAVIAQMEAGEFVTDNELEQEMRSDQ